MQRSALSMLAFPLPQRGRRGEMGSILPQIQCHSKNEMTLYTQCNTSAITMKTCHLFANTLTAFAFTWQPAGAIQAQFAVALTLTPTWTRDHYFPTTYAH